ncbi:MAG: hypothetical protein R3B72_36840 [Polyangiaceae bacterium]
MKLTTSIAVASLVLLTAACDEGKPTSEGSDTKPAPSAAASGETKGAVDEAKPEKLDSASLEQLADAVTFEQGEAKDGTFTGKLKNTGSHDIKLLSFDAFAYGEDGALLERVEGKHNKKLAAGESADIEVGPFAKAKGQQGVTIEVVVGWMNVDGTSYQRPVPKDRAKGGPNNALKK